jgi:phage baseplate assembly protein W
VADRFLYHPFRLGAQGGIAVTDDADRHLRDKVEAALFTAPGERVNNPEFGVGLNRVVFEPLDELMIGVLEFRILTGLQRDLGDEILIDSVRIESNAADGELLLDISFRRRTDRQPRNLEIRL